MQVDLSEVIAMIEARQKSCRDEKVFSAAADDAAGVHDWRERDDECQGIIDELRKKFPEDDDDDSDDPDIEEAVEQCERILSLCDDIPERGEEFAESVRKKTESIRDWIKEHQHVTEAQLQSLENMEEGAGRWIR